MPNWAYNQVTFTHADKAMIDRIENNIESGILQEFIPVPQDLRDTMAGFYGKGDPRQAELEAQQALNKEKHGYTTWYEFCNAEWGTKWDFCDVSLIERTDNSITIYFETAWSPPFQAYEKMVELGFNIRALYSEEQLIWAGIWDNVEGEQHYDFHGWREAQDVLPSEIDDAFGIVERIKEYDSYEEDEDEEVEE